MGDKPESPHWATVTAAVGGALLASAVVASVGIFGAAQLHDDAPQKQDQVVVALSPQAQTVTAAPAPSSTKDLKKPADDADPSDTPEGAPDNPAVDGPVDPAPTTTTAAPTTTTTTTSKPVDSAPAGTPSIRESKPAYLYVRSERPSSRTLEWQFAAIYNPRISAEQKYAVSYRGDTAKVRQNLSQFLSAARTYDFFSVRGSIVGSPKIDGNRMKATMRGTLAGFPVQSFDMYYIRDGGLWKFEWKSFCKASGCPAKDWGY